MSEQLHPNVVRVVEAAAARGLAIEPRSFPDGTKTAADAAAAIGVQLGQIVKSLAAAGGAKCARIDADAVRVATGFPIGGVPPFGHLTHLDVFIDPDLLQYDEVWAAAGTWTVTVNGANVPNGPQPYALVVRGAQVAPPPSAPADPSGLGATASSSSQINLSWVDNSSNEDGFRIERCASASCTSSNSGKLKVRCATSALLISR